MNPSYVAAAKTLSIYSIVVFLLNVFNPLGNLLMGLDKSSADKPGRVLREMAFLNFSSSLFYLLVLCLGLYLARGSTSLVLIVWPLSYVIFNLLRLSVLLTIAGRELAVESLKRMILPGIFYLALSAVLSEIVAPVGYEEKFFSDLILVHRGFLPSLAIFIALVLSIDGWSRETLKRALSKTVRGALGSDRLDDGIDKIEYR